MKLKLVDVAPPKLVARYGYGGTAWKLQDSLIMFLCRFQVLLADEIIAQQQVRLRHIGAVRIIFYDSAVLYDHIIDLVQLPVLMGHEEVDLVL